MVAPHTPRAAVAPPPPSLPAPAKGREYDWDAWKKSDDADKERLRKRVDAIEVQLYDRTFFPVRELIEHVKQHEHSVFGDDITRRGFGLENRIHVLEVELGIDPSAPKEKEAEPEAAEPEKPLPTVAAEA